MDNRHERREHWRLAPGYPGFWASTAWRIFASSTPHTTLRRPGLRRLNKGDDGYVRVSTWGGTPVGAHVIVAAAFIGPRPDGLEVDHVDGDKTNNRPENLEYVTPAENRRRYWERRGRAVKAVRS